VPDGEDILIKILSVDPANYSDAPTEAIRRVRETHTGEAIPRGTPMDLGLIGTNLFASPENACH
jgi:5-oxoprolinase (ATP-hydrolysing)